MALGQKGIRKSIIISVKKFTEEMGVRYMQAWEERVKDKDAAIDPRGNYSSEELAFQCNNQCQAAYPADHTVHTVHPFCKSVF